MKANKDYRKGLWTEEEDRILLQYVKEHGRGKWNRISEATGLKRCGKSCRLRWLNYLSPSVKHGGFSEDEDELIIRLHKLLGNRWSLIAGRVPGRTDNQVKNHWNSHLRKKVLGIKKQQKSKKSITSSYFVSSKPHYSSSSSSSQTDHKTHHQQQQQLHDSKSTAQILSDSTKTTAAKIDSNGDGGGDDSSNSGGAGMFDQDVVVFDQFGSLDVFSNFRSPGFVDCLDGCYFLDQIWQY